MKSHPAELLQAYLDGELPEFSEESMFSMLSASEELRGEFRDMLALREQSYSSLPVLPAHYKNEVMTKLGLHSDNASFGFKGIGFKNTALITLLILTAGLSATVTTAIIGAQSSYEQTSSFHDAPSMRHDLATQSLHSRLADLPSESASPLTPYEAAGSVVQHKAPAETSSALVREHSKVSASAATSARHLANQRQVALRDEILSTHSMTVNIDPAPSSAPPVEDIHTIGHGMVLHVDSSAAPKTMSAEASESDPGVALGVRFFTLRSFPEVPLDPLVKPAFNNFAVSLTYRFGPSHMVAIEAGQEEFFQQFEGVESGRKVFFEQNFLGFWVGAAYQYNLYVDAEKQGVFTFARGFAGGTRVGPLGRLMIGAGYGLSGNTTVNLGVEGGLLLYRYQQAWFSTRKIGLSLGIDVSL